jgi:hypothetical protein
VRVTNGHDRPQVESSHSGGLDAPDKADEESKMLNRKNTIAAALGGLILTATLAPAGAGAFNLRAPSPGFRLGVANHIPTPPPIGLDRHPFSAMAQIGGLKKMIGTGGQSMQISRFDKVYTQPARTWSKPVQAPPPPPQSSPHDNSNVETGEGWQ